MELSKKNKREVTRYLLGAVAAEEQTAMEEKYLSDQSFFEQVVAVEKELLDDYARNRLSSNERELFERHYLAHPKRRARAMTALALVSTLDGPQNQNAEAETSSWLRNLFAGFRGQVLAYGMAALSLLLALGGAWLLFETRRLRSELTSSQTAQSATERRERELSGLIAEQRDRQNQLLDELEKLRADRQQSGASSLSFVSLLLIAGQDRDSGAEIPLLVIPEGVDQAQLRLKIREGGYARYRISIQTADGRTIRTLQNLHHSPNNIFTIWLPTRILNRGEYVISLSGVDDNGEIDNLSKTIFRVESKARTTPNQNTAPSNPR